MRLFPEIEKAYTRETMSARQAQRMAQFISWGPVVFQVSRLAVKFGVLDALRESGGGLTRPEVCERTGLSDYAAKCLLEASLCIGLVLANTAEDRFSLSKTGWFLLTDAATRVNMDFNHDVNYEGMFRLGESFLSGKPEGLRHFGPWPTIYEGLSSLPADVQKSWFGFDHFYSDSSFPEALEIVFGERRVRSLYDVGGNTGKWALQCVGRDPGVEVTVLDLPRQIETMRSCVAGKLGAERISGYGIDLLDPRASFPRREGGPDVIWMSQFLDCFSMEEIVSILERAARAMGPDSRVYIMETLWDRQRYESAAFCIAMTSLYFTALANGNSKMYNTEDLEACVEAAGLETEKIYDGLGWGHSILVCRMKNRH